MNADWDCFIRARRGEEDAWRGLLETHQSRLTAMALFVTGSAAAAKDIVQETFVRAYRASIKDCSGTVHGYLGTIAYRLALKEVKRVKRNAPLNEVEQQAQSSSPLDDLLRNERECLVASAIGTLDDDHRQILILRCYGDHSYEEIAGLLQIPLGTVKSRMFYAIKTCRENLRRKGVLE